MTALAVDAGSFRDPSSRVFSSGGRVLRAIHESGAQSYEAFRDSGLLERLIDDRKLVASSEVEPALEGLGHAPFVLEHPRLPFVSYPYEWCFSLHRSAALHHLDLQLEALEAGFTLSDATAYNIQFEGTRPVFIDHPSLRPYVDGELWLGHRQFCMQFLNPLLMWAKLGIAPNSWFRGGLEGIAPEDLSRLLSWRHNLSFTVLSHVTGQAAVQRQANRGKVKVGSEGGSRLSRAGFKAMLSGLRSYIDGLSIPQQQTVWGNYAHDNSYKSDEAARKHRFVGKMVAQTKPARLFDLGCNSGDYSQTAIESGAGYVVGFDFDFGALEAAVARSKAKDLPFLPLWLDAANPSPSQGWAQGERRGLNERADADAVVALAFIHHIAIARNVPLGMVIDWIMAMAPVGVIEFPPKSDPMVQQLLANRADIFADYTAEHFQAQIRKLGRIVETEELSPGGRLLVSYDRR